MGGGGTWSAPPLPGGFPGESPDAPRACDRSKRRLSEDPSNVTMSSFLRLDFDINGQEPVDPHGTVFQTLSPNTPLKLLTPSTRSPPSTIRLRPSFSLDTPN